jgi:sugar phosphate isomerase/epimerase
MKNIESFNRRQFLHAGLVASTVLATAIVPSNVSGASTKEPRDPFRGLKMGLTSYTLRKFSLDQAIAMTQQTGLKYISLKDMHLPLTSTPAERREVRRKIEAAGLTLMGGGVIYINNKEDEVRAAFEYAKDAGMPTIVCSPDPAALDLLEKMAKQYQIRIAIHNHGPGDKRYPSPLDVLRLVKDRDPLLGLCIDVGHTVRLGEDAVEVIQRCGSRLYDFHMKDVTQATAKGAATEVGKGIIDIVGVLKTLLSLKFGYHLALEYETNADAPMPGMIESLAYIRGALASMD